MQEKPCRKCQKVLPLSEFGLEKRSADRLRYLCRACDRLRNAKYHATNRQERNRRAREQRTANPEKDKAYGRKYRAAFVWRTMIQRAKKRAAKFGWAYDLDQHTEAIKSRLEPMVCEMTGVKLVPGVGAGSAGRRFWNTASLDRIDPAKGYTISNVRVVCWAMNCAMGTWGETVLRELMTEWLNKG